MLTIETLEPIERIGLDDDGVAHGGRARHSFAPRDAGGFVARVQAPARLTMTVRRIPSGQPHGDRGPTR